MKINLTARRVAAIAKSKAGKIPAFVLKEVRSMQTPKKTSGPKQKPKSSQKPSPKLTWKNPSNLAAVLATQGNIPPVNPNNLKNKTIQQLPGD
jgi:hypothetical protein